MNDAELNAARRRWIIRLHESVNIGWGTIAQIVGVGNWLDYDRYTLKDWQTMFELNDKQIRGLSARLAQSDEWPDNIQVMTLFDDPYPSYLLHTERPPWVLYLSGNVHLMHRPSLAIVGTRAPTPEGLRMAFDLSRSLSKEFGFTIISGMAEGIDKKAHEGALEGGEGNTIAITGPPLDTYYPRSHHHLYKRIVHEGGLLISEIPLGQSIHKGQFVIRNRLIAGLSMGTIVVEAAKRSGSMITLTQALDMGRETFVVAGLSSSPRFEGCHNAVEYGWAKSICSARDVAEEFGWRLNIPALHVQPDFEPAESFTPEQQHIYSTLQYGPLSFDELSVVTSTSFGQLHYILIQLILMQKIERLAGNMYRVT